MPRVFLSFGSNVGDKLANIEGALKQLEKKCTIIKKSSWYKTAPMYYEDQDWFVNGVVEIETGLEPEQLRKLIKTIENSIGKKEFKNGPRALDLDILFYDKVILSTDTLTIPHPKLQERAFVLVPLVEIAPELLHPQLKKTVQILLEELKETQDIEKITLP